MLRIELIYDWMCDMSSRVDATDNKKSVVRFRWFVIISQDQLRLPRELPRQIKRFVRLRRQKIAEALPRQVMFF